MAFTIDDLCRLVKTTGAEVSMVDISPDRVLINFGRPVEEKIEKFDRWPRQNGQDTTKDDIIADELLEQEKLDDLLITDPAEYERQLRFEDAEKVNKNDN